METSITLPFERRSVTAVGVFYWPRMFTLDSIDLGGFACESTAATYSTNDVEEAAPLYMLGVQSVARSGCCTSARDTVLASLNRIRARDSCSRIASLGKTSGSSFWLGQLSSHAKTSMLEPRRRVSDFCSNANVSLGVM